MNELRSERGQAAVLTVIFLAALLGAVALVLDVGSWFREQRNTQAAADAAALAAAQELPYNTALADARVASYLAKNRGGEAQITYSHKWATNDTITVDVERSAPGVFSKLFGIDSVDVDARAVARAAGLEAARWVAPIVVNIKHEKLNCDKDEKGRPVPCFGQPTTLTLAHLHKPGSGDAAGAFGLINLDRADTGSVGGSTLGKWIDKGFDGTMPIGDYTSVPSAKFNDSHVKGALNARMNDPARNVLLFPIYKSITGSGSTAVYVIAGWVGFKVTSFKASGSEGEVKGSFQQVIWEGIQSASGANLNFGVRSVALVG